jgi:hypothetical protein
VEKARIARRGDGRLGRAHRRRLWDGAETGWSPPPFDQAWLDDFIKGHELRKRWWRERNERAMKAVASVRANL